MQRNSAFTLVELLVVVGIICILAALVFPLWKNLESKMQVAAEISGARNAIRGWQSYASENNGMLLRGYLSFADSMKAEVKNIKGQALSFPVSARYVFRLAPYLSGQLKGSLLVNDQKKLTDDYSISMAPSFGLNLTFVGGDYGSGSDLIPSDASFATYGKFVVQRLHEIHSPSKLIVFASSRINEPDAMDGYNAVKSPYLLEKRWADSYQEKQPYYDYGAIHPRFDGKAACAMADGHVALLAFEELFDMRRWSNQAAEADDPNWTLHPL